MSAGRPALTSREEIIKAARKIFQKEGIAGLSVRSVAAAVDAAPSTIYNYFGTKQGMMAVLADDLLAGARPEIKPGKDPLDALRQWMVDYRQLLLKTPELIVLAHASGPVASVFKIGHDLYELLLLAGLSESEAAICSRSIQYTVNGFVLQEIGQKNLGVNLADLAPQEELPIVLFKQQFNFDQVFERTVAMNVEGIRALFPKRKARAKKS